MKYDFLLVWGIFRKFPVQAKLSFSPYACCVHARGGGRESFPFFQGKLHCAWFCLDSLKSCLDGGSVIVNKDYPFLTVNYFRNFPLWFRLLPPTNHLCPLICPQKASLHKMGKLLLWRQQGERGRAMHDQRTNPFFGTKWKNGSITALICT